MAGSLATKLHFGGSAYKFSEIGLDSEKQIYVGFVAVMANLLVAIIVTAVLRSSNAPAMTDDATSPEDYFVDRTEDAPPPAAASQPTVSAGP